MKLGTIKTGLLLLMLLSGMHLSAYGNEDEKELPKPGFSVSGTLGGPSLLGSLDLNYRFFKNHELSLGASILPHISYRNYFLKLSTDARVEVYGSLSYGYWKPVVYGQYYDSQILAPALGVQWKDPSHSIALSLEVLYINWIWTENGHNPMFISSSPNGGLTWAGIRAGFNPGNAIRAFKNR